ncbi:MAG: DUF218 domain-containing protein [Lachnospiraceae bacterium]|nr:DUF218 domain-containing protein [Lachnospiraceae bacterium]
MRALLICCLFMVAAGVLCLFAGDHYVRKAGKDKILGYEDLTGLPQMDCILVLGCGLRPDGEPTQMLKDRLDAGIALYQTKTAPKLLMSGDHGRQQYDEVNRMKQYAMEKGVPSQDIFMDHAGFSTYESMYRARDVFQVKQMVIVSQEYHLYRAIYDGEKMGLKVWGYPAKQIRYGGQRRRDLREILARNKDILYCLLQPEPTYLGEAIPVSGNGDLTNDKKDKEVTAP